MSFGGKPSHVMRNQEATVYIGNLDEKVTEALLQELMIQIGPIAHAHIPRDRITQLHQGYGFVEFQSEYDAEYALKVMNGVKLFGKPIRINKSSMDRKSLDVGANLFIGNLSPEVDEKLLFDTFILFGTLLQTPKIAREESTGISRGFGFVSYDSFEASDAAIESMNGQFLCNRPISVNYAFKKDGKGERHGSAAERLLAIQTRKAAIAAGLITVTTPTVSPSMPQSHIMPMPYANFPQMPTMNPQMMMYPSNVPSSMYYSSQFPFQPASFQSLPQGYQHPAMPPATGYPFAPPPQAQPPFFYYPPPTQQ